ncbi:MAG: hypothetical protein ABIK30_10835 [bacterium]
MNILILAALTRELVPIQDQLVSVFERKPAVSLNFKKIPVGLKESHFNFREFQSGKSVDICINTGMAGAVSSDLQLLDIFFPSVFIDDKNQSISFQTPELLTGIMPEEWKTGTLFTSKKPVLSTKRKNEIISDYRAHAVDMEAYTIAKACVAESIPFVSLKVISDTADSDTMTIFKQNLDKAAEKLSRHLKILIDLLRNKEGTLL